MAASASVAQSNTDSQKVKLARNPVHDYFKYNVDKKCSQCESCATQLKGKNPTTLVNHLKSKHPTLFKVYIEKKLNAQKNVLEQKEKDKSAISRPNTLGEDGASGISVKDLVRFNSKDVFKWSYNDPRQKKVTRKIALTIATSTLPVNIVSNNAFKDLIEELNPHARIPAKDKTRKEVNQIWCEVRELIVKALGAARKVSITTDIWTSKGCTTSYLGITVHYFNPVTRTRGANKIACREFSSAHTSKNIAELIMKVCEEYTFESKLTYIASDNGSNMIKAVSDFNRLFGSDNNDEEEDLENLYPDDEEMDIGNNETDDSDDSESEEDNENEVITEIEEFEERDQQFDSVLVGRNVRRAKCFSHTMQCAINRGIKVRNLKFGKVLNKTKKFINKYKKSAKAKTILSATTFKKKLVGYVKTRWFTELAMSKSIIEAFEKEDKPLSLMTEKMGWNLEISVQDIRSLKIFVDIMEPFAKHTDILGGENYSTIQLVYPTLLELLAHLEQMSKTPGMVRVCDSLEKEIRKYFAHVMDVNAPDFDSTYLAATFLDPCWFDVLNEDQCSIAKKHLKELCNKYVAEENNNVTVNDTDDEDVSFNNVTFRNYQWISKKLSIDRTGIVGSRSSNFENDINIYMKECVRIRQEISTVPKKRTEDDDVIMIENETDDSTIMESTSASADDLEEETSNEQVAKEVSLRDPLDYWVAEEKRYYSSLAKVAQDLLTIPATSTPSERLFSASGILSDGKMACISPANLERRVLVKVNINKTRH